ncbi:MAG: redoxin domain-containing protein [bacterium]
MQRHFLIITTMLLALLAAVAVQAGDKTAETKESATLVKTAETPVFATVGKAAPDFTLVDATGEKHSLSDYRDKFVVLEWVNFGCPFVKKFYGTGTMRAMQKEFQAKNVVWLSICSSAPGKQGFYDEKHLPEAIAENKWQASAYLVDADGTVGQLYRAKTTPNMYVVDPNGVLIYAGAMDDQPTPSTESLAGAMNYVYAALTSAMIGKPVEITMTQPYGCGVKYSQN